MKNEMQRGESRIKVLHPKALQVWSGIRKPFIPSGWKQKEYIPYAQEPLQVGKHMVLHGDRNRSSYWAHVKHGDRYWNGGMIVIERVS